MSNTILKLDFNFILCSLECAKHAMHHASCKECAEACIKCAALCEELATVAA